MKLSPEERKERIKEYNKRRYQNMTDEQREKRKEKRKEYQRKYYERNRGDRPRRILFPNLTEEERKERKRECYKRRYQNRTEEQKNKTITPH